MNRPIVRLYGLVVLLFALLIAFTSRWTIFEASSLRGNPLNARALLEQERIARGPILASNGDGARAQRARRRRHLPADLPERVAVRADGRLRLHRPDADGHRALSQHGAERGNERHEPAGDPRPATGQAPPGRRNPDHARPLRAARRDRGAGRTQRRGGRARSARRGGEGDGLLAELQPQHAERTEQLRKTRARVERAAAEPRAAIWLRPRLDLQGRHGDRGDRHGAVHAVRRRSAGATTCSSPACRWRTTTTKALAS